MTQQKARTSIAVVGGGPSPEHEVSLRSAENVFRNLPAAKYDKRLIVISKTGAWFDAKTKKPLTVIHPARGAAGSDLKKFDVVFNALHGAFGEDGAVQAILEAIGVPSTGSGVLASALGMDKFRASRIAAGRGIDIPPHILLRSASARDAAAWASRAGYPVIAKPNASGSSVGISIVRNPEEIRGAIKKIGATGGILFQKFIRGREFTCGVLGNEGEKLLPLPPVEIVHGAEFFDYEAKYHSDKTREICPADIPQKLTNEIKQTATAIHDALGCDGLTRSDFMLDSREKLYFLEINTSPGLTRTSLCPKEALAAGIALPEFFDRIAELALERGKIKV